MNLGEEVKPGYCCATAVRLARMITAAMFSTVHVSNPAGRASQRSSESDSGTPSSASSSTPVARCADAGAAESSEAVVADRRARGCALTPVGAPNLDADQEGERGHGGEQGSYGQRAHRVVRS